MPDNVFDVVVVGSGIGGLTAAITARLAGMKTLLIEKTALIGGSSILSGGVLWLPNNPLMGREGIVDSRQAGLDYLANFVAKDAPWSRPARREAFVDAIAPMIAAMEAQGMKYLRCPGYSDYYDDKPGGNAAGRSVQAELFDANRLGAWKARLRLPAVPFPIRTSEAAELLTLGVSLKGKLMAARVAGRIAQSRLMGRAVFGSGGALQGRMLEIALRLGVEIQTDARLIDFDLTNGRVEGVHIDHAGKGGTIRASRGVIVAAGGFARNLPMRQHYQRHPISDAWTKASPGDTGEAIQAMVKAGAALGMMEEAWWLMSFIVPGDDPYHAAPEIVKPHGILVDHAGNRFANESASYMEVGRACYDRNATTPAIPAWLVMDAQARKKYMFCFRPPGKMPKDWIDHGYLKQDATLDGLALQCGIDPAGLAATVARFNEYCKTGVDLDYGRGSSRFNRYYADPTMKPNPALGTIAKPPFWAAPLWPGDAGTGGGVITNEHAQVLRPDSTVIEGLYATGNCTASLVGPYYVGAGQSIAASGVFGHIAALHAVNR